MSNLPTFPLSQIWGVDTGIHGDDLLYRFDSVAKYVGFKGSILPSSEQRIEESFSSTPYAQYEGERTVDLDRNWTGRPEGAENRRLPDSNDRTNDNRSSSGFGGDKGDTLAQLADLAVKNLPPGIRNYAQMIEPELRKLIPIETIATIEKGREIYEVAKQISSDWRDLATVNKTLPFNKAPETIALPGDINLKSDYINSGIFGGRVKRYNGSNSQISWYLNPTFSSAYQNNVGINDLPGGYV
jgi:hypothetical protein